MDAAGGAHLSRVRHLREAFSSANERLVGRLRAAEDGAAETSIGSAWSAAQVGWHVAAVNTRFAALISGDAPHAKPLPDGFQEKPWAEIESALPEKIDAPTSAHPPAGVTRHDVIAALEASGLQMARALDTMTAERGSTLGVTNALVGTINLYQVGEWAAGHVERHVRQVAVLLESN
ncbi:MAG: DinB family protein [Vicinamibacterales bacterium]